MYFENNQCETKRYAAVSLYMNDSASCKSPIAATVKAAGKVLLYEKSPFPPFYFSVMRTLVVMLQSLQ